jgi:YD repeat-containing protein
MTALTPPDRSAHGFNYTPVNLTESYSPPAVGAGATQTAYTYNKDRQLTLVTRPDGKTIQLAYDSGGRLSTMTMPQGNIRYIYSSTTGNLQTISISRWGDLELCP